MLDIMNFLYDKSVDIATGVTAVAALVISIIAAKRSAQVDWYSNFDTIYKDILSQAIQKPRFRNPGLTKQYKESFQNDEFYSYSTYAYTAMNLVETICDLCEEKNWKTWVPVLIQESTLHRTWFSDNPNKFKQEFRNYVIGELEKFDKKKIKENDLFKEMPSYPEELGLKTG